MKIIIAMSEVRSSTALIAAFTKTLKMAGVPIDEDTLTKLQDLAEDLQSHPMGTDKYPHHTAEALNHKYFPQEFIEDVKIYFNDEYDLIIAIDEYLINLTNEVYLEEMDTIASIMAIGYGLYRSMTAMRDRIGKRFDELTLKVRSSV